ncbi:MAG: hypothetical protein KGO53_03910 [Alphaproteobacteria bacterium]|nr:hypothetical protein [Alphaproteobacteria bacterium]
MSQTETLMVLALGSALTVVVFLLFGRVFWGIAMAAGARRRAKDVPVQMLELQADRDRLRAEHALMARKLDLRLEDIKTRMAEQMAEVSRNRNRVQSLLEDLARKDEALKLKDRETAALTAQMEVSRAEAEAAHQTIDNLTAEARRHEQEMENLQGAFRKLGATLREKNAMVGNLNEELKAAIASPSAAAETGQRGVESRLRERVAQLTSISADMSREADKAHALPAAEAEPAIAPLPEALLAKQDALNQKVAETERLSEEMERELKTLDELLAAGSAPAAAPNDAAPPAARRQGAMANVVSLAQRIRALQNGMND